LTPDLDGHLRGGRTIEADPVTIIGYEPHEIHQNVDPVTEMSQQMYKKVSARTIQLGNCDRPFTETQQGFGMGWISEGWGIDTFLS